MHGDVVVIVEPTIRGYVHACTPDDVVSLLKLIPHDDLEGLKLFVLCQPTRKEKILSPRWGRFEYHALIGHLQGPAIFLESQDLNRCWRYRSSMSVEFRREFERLIADGHHVSRVRRGYEVKSSLEATRNTQLYRTLAHEIGHHVDYQRSVVRPGAELDDKKWWEELERPYRTKLYNDKEAFAHRYARELAEHLLQAGKVPFNQVVDHQRLRAQNLDPAWFGLEIGQPD